MARAASPVCTRSERAGISPNEYAGFRLPFPSGCSGAPSRRCVGVRRHPSRVGGASTAVGRCCGCALRSWESVSSGRSPLSHRCARKVGSRRQALRRGDRDRRDGRGRGGCCSDRTIFRRRWTSPPARHSVLRLLSQAMIGVAITVSQVARELVGVARPHRHGVPRRRSGLPVTSGVTSASATWTRRRHGRRRQDISVLSADLVGFTTSPSLDAGRGAAVLDAYWGVADRW